MGALPPIKRVAREDLPGAPTWIERLLFPLNLFFDSVYNSLNKNITFKENINCQLQQFTVVAGATPVDNTTEFNLTLKQKPQGLILISAVEKSGNFTPISNAIFIDWYYDGINIHIVSITGLTATKTYNFNVLII